MASGSKVNLYRSGLVGIHVDQREVLNCDSILNCTTMTIPFVYSGLHVGKDARKMTT